VPFGPIAGSRRRGREAPTLGVLARGEWRVLVTIVVVLAVVTAVAAAVRGTWSPCGLSMLSTVTPLAEAGRGRRWGVTAAWFVGGAVLGGLTLGAVMAGLAAVVGALGPSTAVVLGIATVAALVCAASDLDPFGIHLPFHGRQVNERWLDQYRAWVYGAGFGWQIGCGLATYITTAGMYLTILLGALTGQPLVALAIGAGFGLLRGLAIFAGRHITDTDHLLAVHRRFGALRRPVRLAVIGVMLAVGVVAGTAWAGVPGLVGSALAAVAIVVVANLSHRHAPELDPAVPATPASLVG
jgi:MFS family permease